MPVSLLARLNSKLNHNLTCVFCKNTNLHELRKRLSLHNRSLTTLPKINKTEDTENSLYKLIDKYEEKIIFSSIIEQQKLKLGYKKNKAFESKFLRRQTKISMKFRSVEPLPISLKYLTAPLEKEPLVKAVEEVKKDDEIITQFPFETSDNFTENDQNEHRKGTEIKSENIQNEILTRQSNYEIIKHDNWMMDYENYDDKDLEGGDDKLWKLNYGTPNPKSSVSNIPCGGCGALLHCKDTSIPGYIPSEIFSNHKLKSAQNLSSLICQRCHFLKYYDMALQVRVTAEDYPRILMSVKENSSALAIVMVDLLDFPCSVWPNIIDIIGSKRPVILVGNKVDLLPQDSRGYLQRIQDILSNTVRQSGLSRVNIKHVSLISAKTGYGVEELITKLHTLWHYEGDVYLIGCTNVGKSTLFNALLQSDYCKIQAVDLVQRATTSLWPGTTLNLLKFPILRPSGWRLFVRTKRLQSLNKIKSQEDRIRRDQLRNTKNPKYATLMGHIERTFRAEEPVTESRDIFSLQGHENASGKIKMGINEKDPIYKLSKWCFDTPGVVHPDQILHLLTTEELVLTLPKQLIQPRIFCLKPGSTIFVGGLGRLDFIEGPISMRFTIFASDHLPITICQTVDAEDLYKELLGTDLLQVPKGNDERLKKWPPLEAGEDIKLVGEDWETSCKDIVLSSAGWISVSCGYNVDFTLKAWTPEKRGLYVRDSILPKAVSLRGRRIRFSPAYRKSKFFIPQ